MNLSVSFNSDSVSPPGETIKDILLGRQFAMSTFASRANLSLTDMERLLVGELEIDDALAGRLSTLLGASKRFWLNREHGFRHGLERIKELSSKKWEGTFLKQLPLRDMKAFGWLRSFASLPLEEAIRKFFGGNDGEDLGRRKAWVEAVAFRMSSAHQTNPAAVVAWLQQGAIQARDLDCLPWDSIALQEAMPAIRSLTRLKHPKDFFPKLVEICKSCGVAVVFVRTPKGCTASGATHFASSTKAIIQLSFRYRSDDHFWFTFFHEAAHLMLHGDSSLFVEGSDIMPTDEETEANRYSAQTLVSAEDEPDLMKLGKNFRGIMRFARRTGVSPGIVVGQLQNRGVLRHDQMNFLKARYDWSDIQEITL
jgi:HTH-type transcriptional regulator / antitoxin HigA